MHAFKKHHKYIYRVLMTFVYLLLPVLLAIFIMSRTSLLGGYRTFTVLTGSMEPTIPVGSIVLVAPSSIYQVGDIIAFKRGQKTITHRIKTIANGMYQTKGDANDAADPQKISKFQIIGRDIAIIPYVGKVMEFIKTVPGFFLLIVLPVTIFIAFEARTIKREWEKEIEKKLLKKMQTIEKV